MTQVLTDVPTGAKFTDTTYSEITEPEMNAGSASTDAPLGEEGCLPKEYDSDGRESAAKFGVMV